MNKFSLSLFIFRRDLRLDDNIGLQEALRMSDQVIPCFIIDEQQVGDKNQYKSANALQFMLESLEELNQLLEQYQTKLYIFHGNPAKIIRALHKEVAFDAVFVNRDYTPYSLERDEHIKRVCNALDIAWHQFDDYLLNAPEAIVTGSGDPYSIFTAYYKNASRYRPAKPAKNKADNYYRKKIMLACKQKDLFKQILPTKNKFIWQHGGRSNGLALLAAAKFLQDYQKTRDFPVYQTSNLSAHNKFGTVSIREVYYGLAQLLGEQHPLVRQLYWRDFFTTVAYFSPFVFGQPFHEKYASIAWSHDRATLHAWQQGMTGFPIVDAGMRQLVQTGFMHNRVRMIVGSFLVKDLHHNWLEGEQFFAQHLIDYDPCVNNGNWQWVASTGCDATPYFRIFNPWLQQKKFDPACVYIKTWLPALRNVPVKDIHQWFSSPVRVKNYPKPIVDHGQQAAMAKEMYKKAR